MEMFLLVSLSFFKYYGKLSEKFPVYNERDSISVIIFIENLLRHYTK